MSSTNNFFYNETWRTWHISWLAEWLLASQEPFHEVGLVSYVKNFGSNNLNGRDHMEDLGVDGNIILKQIFVK